MKKNIYYIAKYPKISIITCVYNGEKYISKLLDSVLNMGYPNIEHIIVNDGSTDGTEGIVMKYSELYKNKAESNLYIKYVKQENMGLGGATNTGLKEITGEYWTWINCDDWYEPNAFFEPTNILMNNKMLDYIQLNGYYCGNGSGKEIIVQKKNGIHFKNKYRLMIDFCSRSDFKYLLYICRTNSFKNINPNMRIFPSKFTQDIQLLTMIFSTMNGDICLNPKWNFLRRSDSVGEKNNIRILNEKWFLYKKTINSLNVDNRTKHSLILIKRYDVLLSQLVKNALIHNWRICLSVYVKLIKVKYDISLRYRLYLNKKAFLYLLYSFLFFLNRGT